MIRIISELTARPATYVLATDRKAKQQKVGLDDQTNNFTATQNETM
jgi:hypothetical protein